MSFGPIAVFSHTPPSVTRGGAENSAYALYMGLRRLGYDAVLISACSLDDADKVITNSIYEHTILYNQKEYNFFYHISPESVTQSVLSLIEKLGCRYLIFHHFIFFGVNTVRRMIDTNHEVVLVLHEFLALCHHHGQMVTRPNFQLCKNSNPTSCMQCFPQFDLGQFTARKILLLENFAGVKAFVSPSQFLADRCCAWGFPIDKFVIIENGVLGFDDTSVRENERDEIASLATAATTSTNDFHGTFPVEGGNPVVSNLYSANNSVATSSSHYAHGIVIGYFGQINSFKGLDVLLGAAEVLALEAGPQKYIFRVHGKIVELNERTSSRFDDAVLRGIVDYRGAYDNVEVFALMQECDFILMTSRWWENSPVVIQEAFHAQRPLIVPGIGGMAEKVKHCVSGLHFRPSDSSDLARVCRIAATKSQASFSFPAPLSPSEMARRYISIFAL